MPRSASGRRLMAKPRKRTTPKPELVALTKALHALANDIEARRAFARDAAAFAGAWHVEGLQAQLLAAFDVEAMVALGVHPLVLFLARMQIDRERGTRA
jgi:2,3-dihydroxyphenylpropionate 1,2-dioxygenase